ncbi:arsenate reductase (glutaredoxin) [Xanthobacter sp. AM11]|uniref:arsenate reductase (glutaredoxin) n=1 Tax=Xanthobacter sp. AM11 TaxID=3380643 RepID=UPI0039BF2141
MDVTVDHTPACGTARNTLAMIRNAGIEPQVIEYLKTPPTRARLMELIAKAGLTVRDVIRQKGTPYAEPGRAGPALGDDALLDAMMAHPILINRPIVVSPLGAPMCRPCEKVPDLLPPQLGPFTKEDGEHVMDAAGHRITSG